MCIAIKFRVLGGGKENLKEEMLQECESEVFV